MSVVSIRHQNEFNPLTFKDQVDVIGAGATGSRIAIALAKMGIENLRVWDFDNVESHNVANQAYGNQDIGKPKVEVLRSIIWADCGVSIKAMNQSATGSDQFGKYVFVLTDTMYSRKELVDSMRFNGYTTRIFETRMGIDHGLLFSFSPNDSHHLMKWDQLWFPDEKASDNPENNGEGIACNAKTVVGSTASMLASITEWNFMAVSNFVSGNLNTAPPNYVQYCSRPGHSNIREYFWEKTNQN